MLFLALFAQLKIFFNRNWVDIPGERLNTTIACQSTEMSVICTQIPDGCWSKILNKSFDDGGFLRETFLRIIGECISPHTVLTLAGFKRFIEYINPSIRRKSCVLRKRTDVFCVSCWCFF